METYFKGLIQVREERKKEFTVYLYTGRVYSVQAILYGEENKKAYLRGIGAIK